MTFLDEPPSTPRIEALYGADVASYGYVMNLSRVWAHQPDSHDALFALLASVAHEGGLTIRDRAVLVAACASTMGDAYCSLAWGTKLASESDPAVAAAVLTGTDAGLTDAELTDTGLTDAERAMARWARAVAADPNATTAADVQALRDAGLDDARIFAATVFIALRIAFSTVNDALGAVPDDRLRDEAPAPVRAAVTWGR